MPRGYQAFISYRHAELDSRVAAEVQRALERFRIPSAVRKQTGVRSLAPVFRDKEELPVTSELSREIAEALENSSFLIVICSPRLAESLWCQREIESFLATHDQDHVLTVLAEGEPEDVIPEVLLTRVQEVTLEDGSTQTVRVPIEPLSCDFRTSRASDRRTEATRLAAAMLDVSFDALVRRQRRRRRRLAIAAAIAAASIIAYGAWSLVQIRAGLRATQVSQSAGLARDALGLYEDGNPLEALELALAALPGEGGDRPVVAEAELALQQISHAYVPVQAGQAYQRSNVVDYGAVRSFAMPGEIEKIVATPDGARVAAYTYGGWVRAWDTSTGELLYDARHKHTVVDIALRDDGCLAVLLIDSVYCVSLKDGTELWEQSFDALDEGDATYAYEFFEALVADDELDAFVAVSDLRCLALDATDGTVKAEVSFADLPGETINSALSGACFEAGEGSAGIVCSVEDMLQDSSYRVVLADLASGGALLSRDVFGEVSALKALPDGRMLVSSLVVGAEAGVDYFRSNRQFSCLTPYDQLVSCLDVRTGETLWTQAIHLWQVQNTAIMFEMPLALKDETRDAVVWCGANICSWLDAQTGELLGSVETTSSFVSAWPGPHREPDDVSDVRLPKDNEVIEGLLIDGEAVAVTPSEGVSRSVTTYPANATQMISTSAGELVVADAAVLLFARGQGDASWREASDVRYLDSDPVTTPVGVALIDTMPTRSSGAEVPSVAMFDPLTASELWRVELPGDSENPIVDYVGLTADGSKLVFYDGKSDQHELVIISCADGSVRNEPVSAANTGQEGQSRLCGESPVICGNNVVSLVTQKGEKGACVAVTDVDTLASEVYLHALERSNSSGCWVDAIASDHEVLVALDQVSGEGEGDSSHYSCTVLDVESGSFTEVSRPVLANFHDGAAQMGTDGTIYAIGSDEVFACDSRGRQRFSVSLDGWEPLTLHLSQDSLDLVLYDGEGAKVQLYDLGTGALLGSHELDVESLGVMAVSTYFGCVRWYDCAPLSEGRAALFYVSTCAIVDEEFAIHQLIESCSGYDASSDSLFVRRAGDDKLGVYERYSTDELVARGQELLGDSRMSEKRRREFGL